MQKIKLYVYQHEDHLKTNLALVIPDDLRYDLPYFKKSKGKLYKVEKILLGCHWFVIGNSYFIPDFKIKIKEIDYFDQFLDKKDLTIILREQNK